MSSTTSKEDARPRRPPEHIVPLLVAPWCIKDSVKGIIHTIFFHRIFGHLRPLDRDISPLPPRLLSRTEADHTVTLPAIDDPDLESEISDRVHTLARRVDKVPTSSIPHRDKHATISIHFSEKKRKKAATGFANFWNPVTGAKGSGDSENVCWESWMIQVTVATAVREDVESDDEVELISARCAQSLKDAAMEVVACTGRLKEHIPPITTQDRGFPYEIVVGSVESR